MFFGKVIVSIYVKANASEVGPNKDIKFTITFDETNLTLINNYTSYIDVTLGTITRVIPTNCNNSSNVCVVSVYVNSGENTAGKMKLNVGQIVTDRSGNTNISG